MRGFLAVLKADPAAAGPPLHAAVAAARQTGQRELLSEALSMASIAANMAGDRAAARRLLDEADAAAASLGRAYPSGLIAVLQARALDGFFDADLGAVRSAAAEGGGLTRETGDLYALEMMLLNLGSAALLDGDLDEAKPLFAEALRIARQIDDRVAQFYLLDALGCHAASPARRGSRRSCSAPRTPYAPGLARTSCRSWLGCWPRPRSRHRGARGSEVHGRVRGRKTTGPGHRAGPGARRARARHAVAASGDAGAGPLGKREADVARLVADGLTNKQIGTRLFISERTVDSHVRSILNKLGFNSRAQIAAWMATDQ